MGVSMKIVTILAMSVLLLSCAESSTKSYEPGVPWSLAEHRAASISNLRYAISVQIPDSLDAPIRANENVSFELRDVSEPVVLDFTQPAAHVISVSVNGRPADHELSNEHLVIPGELFRPGENSIAIELIAGDGSLNRNQDFLYTLFVPDRARVAFPVFDQPNLKGRLKLSLEVPASWKAVSNGRLEHHQINGDRAVFDFAETEPISTYLFSFVAGRFDVESAERNGRQMNMFHRETDRKKLERNRQDIFDLHAAALEWLESYTGIAYSFNKFDFVLIPSFQYRGMEHPGAIYYRADWLLLDETATQNQLLRRASLIAHETAHMWFGNLVTMDWFNDVWMKEVFASFMADKIVNPSFPEIDHELRFLLDHYPEAYRVDRTEGANAIRQELGNLSEAGTLYGAIIYNKAPVVMKHLERVLGEESFRAGLREYLERYRFANASWPDLIEILDGKTEEDLAGWSEVWIEEPRRPTISTNLEIDGGEIRSLAIAQEDPEGRARRWNQRLEVLLGYENGKREMIPVHLREESMEVPVAVGTPAPDYVLPNGLGIGYGHFELDERSRDYLLKHLPEMDSALTRAVAWLSLWEAMLVGPVPPMEIVALALSSLERETDELNIEQVLGDLTRTYWVYLTSDERRDLSPRIEELLWRSTSAASQKTLKSAYFAAYRRMALSEEALERLRRIWEGDEEVPGLSLAERDYSAIAQAIALREVDGAESILERQLERIDNPDRKARFRFAMPSLSRDQAVRDRFFASLKDPRNREHEPWVLDAIAFLHHPLRAEQSVQYIRPSLDLLEEIQRTGDVFFPKGWLDATLEGHSSPRAAAIVQVFLNEREDLPPKLRQKLLQSADPLFRAAKARES